MEIRKSTSYTFTLTESEATRLSEALFCAVSNRSLWDASDKDLALCEEIINRIGTLET
jgi:hypothetical protein